LVLYSQSRFALLAEFAGDGPYDDGLSSEWAQSPGYLACHLRSFDCQVRGDEVIIPDLNGDFNQTQIGSNPTEEPGSFATSFLRLLVDSGIARTP
jgi:hypothetical protein